MRVDKPDKPWRAASARECDACSVRGRCFFQSPLPVESGDCLGVLKRRYPVRSGDRLYRRGSPFSYLFQVCSGTIKTQRETLDGGLVVTGFFFAGDLVGLDAVGDTHYPSDAVATIDSTVCQLDFERLLTTCATEPGLPAWILSRIGLYVRQKDADLSWVMGLQTQRRVLRFFLDLYERLVQAAQDRRPAVTLPMRKQDIARYLHITPETLSRNLAQLHKEGLLHVKQERFELPDLARAREMTRL